METTKKILNIAIAISIVLFSVSLLIFSLKENKAIAQTTNQPKDEYLPAGTVTLLSKVYILGYNPKTGQVKTLAALTYGDIKSSKDDDK